jgi:hypothetical protein
MHELLNKAHRRLITQLLLDKGAMALTVVLGGAVLLLLIGTQILDWYWLVLLAAAGFGVGLYQLRGRIPTKYRVAQRIDRRMRLADVLSTAQYFHEHPDPKRQSVCDLQMISAESAAQSVDIKAALPFARSRYLWPAAVLAASALVLFSVRYAFTGSLDLSSSLVAIAMDTWFGAKTELAKNDFKKALTKPEQGSENSPNQASEEEEKLPESLMENADTADPSTVETASDKQGKEGEKGKQGDQADDKQDGDQKQGDDQKGDSKDGKEGDKDGKQGNPKNESSVLDKVRDALANMLNKMKSDSPKQSQNGQSQQGKSQQDAQKQKSENDGKSSTEQNAGDQNADSQQEQNDAKGGKPDKPPQQESANSMGDKIGDKNIKDAAMLEAMGKISELLGKRQQTLTGEVMVEVGSTKQQLKTPFQQQQASHVDSGSEIHRDEVPLLYQQFVEQYFEEIRKPAAKPANPPVNVTPNQPRQ